MRVAKAYTPEDTPRRVDWVEWDRLEATVLERASLQEKYDHARLQNATLSGELREAQAREAVLVETLQATRERLGEVSNYIGPFGKHSTMFGLLGETIKSVDDTLLAASEAAKELLKQVTDLQAELTSARARLSHLERLGSEE